MKYMNNHFGQSKIFKNAKCKVPMNLQFFGESGDNGDSGVSGGGGSSVGAEAEGGGNPENVPTVEELVAQLAAERARIARLQNDKDAASTEAANYKKQLRAKMSADEQAEAAKAEAEAAKDALIAELQAERRVNNYSKRYMGIGMDETTATELAELTGEIGDVDKFFSALDKFVKSAVKKAGEDSIEALIKKNPAIKAGNGVPEKGALAKEKAIASAKRTGGVNTEILAQYGVGGKR